MDIKIKNGDFAVDENGHIVSVFGFDEILQRIKNRLFIKKGSFLPDRTIGSELYILNSAALNDRDKLAFDIVSKALGDMEEITVNDVRIKDSNEKRLITVLLNIADRQHYLEGTI